MCTATWSVTDQMAYQIGTGRGTAPPIHAKFGQARFLCGWWRAAIESEARGESIHNAPPETEDDQFHAGTPPLLAIPAVPDNVVRSGERGCHGAAALSRYQRFRPGVDGLGWSRRGPCSRYHWSRTGAPPTRAILALTGSRYQRSFTAEAGSAARPAV